MTCQHTKSHSAGTGPTDIVTYRFNGELMYVPLAPNYNHALSHARDAFPQLKGLRDASLSLSLTAPAHGQNYVGISALAWPKLITHMTRYQIIDVNITPTCERTGPIPDITVTYADAEKTEETEPAPPYRRSDVVDDEKAPQSRSRPPLSTTLHHKRSWFIQKLHGQ